MSEHGQQQSNLSSPLTGLGIVLIFCALVYGPMLGSGGLTMSEGHRAIPAWEMMESGEWLVPRMFGQPYLRKPPGMVWAIAGMSSVFGQTALAARMVSAVSATLMALVAGVAAGRWFGRRWFLVGGLAQALMPIAFVWGRTGEIETLNALGAQLVMFGWIEAVRVGCGRWAWIGAASAGIGVVIAGLAKGPGFVPCSAGAVIGCSIAYGWRRGFGQWRSWLGLAGGGAVVLSILWRIALKVSQLDSEPVTQSVQSFMWSRDRLGGVVLLPLAAWASALPMSLGFLFVWGPDARRECVREETREHLVVARALAWTWVGAIAVLVISGISNPRYALPAASVMPLLTVHVLAAFGHGMIERRRKIARGLMLGKPVSWVLVLVVAAGVFMFTREKRVRASSGQQSGTLMGQAVVEAVHEGRVSSDGGTVWLGANHLIEARPEVLWYAVTWARKAGVDLRIRWWPDGLGGDLGMDLLAVRTDGGSCEAQALPRRVPIFTGQVHKYAYEVAVPEQ